MRRRDRGEWPFIAGILIVLLSGAGLIGFVVWREVVHPCVRYIQATCSECRSSVPVFDGDGHLAADICIDWADVPCRQCAERAP